MDSISEKEVKLFCRYASDIHVERGTCIADEYDPRTMNANEIGNHLPFIWQKIKNKQLKIFQCVF